MHALDRFPIKYYKLSIKAAEFWKQQALMRKAKYSFYCGCAGFIYSCIVNNLFHGLELNPYRGFFFFFLYFFLLSRIVQSWGSAKAGCVFNFKHSPRDDFQIIHSKPIF